MINYLNITFVTTSLPNLSDYIAEQCSGISDSVLFTQCRARAVREYGELSKLMRRSNATSLHLYILDVSEIISEK